MQKGVNFSLHLEENDEISGANLNAEEICYLGLKVLIFFLSFQS